jgi:CSLREA domain-containing protein
VAAATLGATAVFAANAQAATYTVTTTADNGPGTCTASECTLRDAITAANTNGTAGTPDTIDLSGVSGTITLDPTGGPIVINDPGGLSINGPGAGTLAVSGGHQTGIFAIAPTSGQPPVSISGLTLTAGAAGTSMIGGAIADLRRPAQPGGSGGSPLTLTNDTITGNTAAAAGGGIYSTNALVISGSTITGNTAGTVGGGIGTGAKYRPAMTIENSTISGNTAQAGGGIGSDDKISITGSHIDNNQATNGPAGGILAGSYSSLSLTESTVSGNTSLKGGGGILSYVQYGMTIDHATVSNNTAAYGGGLAFGGSSNQDPVLVQASTISGNHAARGAGILIETPGTAPITVKASTISGNQGGSGSSGGGLLIDALTSPFDLVDSTISGNSATNGGGVSLGDSGSPGVPTVAPGASISFDNSTIAANTAASSGGGIYLAQYNTGSGDQSATAAINSTIVANNSANGAPNDLFRPTTSTSGGFNDTFSLIENPGNAPLLTSQALITGVDPQLAALGANGGPTLTMLPSNTSPVIDQGKAGAGLTTDQRGDPRTVDNGKPRPPGGDGTDIGAVELAATPTIRTIPQPGSVTVGGSAADTAAVSGGDDPSGTVTFNLYDNPNGTGTPLFTDTEPLSGGTATSKRYTTAGTGTDYWVATYNGDRNNNPVASGLAEEPVSVSAATPTIRTQQQPASATVGGSVADAAAVSGGDDPSGTVTFNLYDNPNGTGRPLFTDTEPLSGGTATSKRYTTAATGTDYWVATYNGDRNNNPVASGLAEEPVSVSAATPTIRGIRAVARVLIARLRPVPLRRACAVERGRDARESTAISTDATCRRLRLILSGTIQLIGRPASSATGTIRASYTVRLPRGRAAGGARARVRHGRWRITLVLNAVNLDPLPPSYLITIHYDGDRTIQPAKTTRHIRLESERVGLHP